MRRWEKRKKFVFIVPMRNWNISSHAAKALTVAFLSYLWGIETKKLWRTLIRMTTFLSYLWGIETLSNIFSSLASPCFYRTYEELKLHKAAIAAPIVDVFIVPMRNWNRKGLPICQRKQSGFLSYLWGIETRKPVSIVTRDDSFYRTYEELKHWSSYNGRTSFSVFIVPMRNWNLI